jgi:hypothetical protein
LENAHAHQACPILTNCLHPCIQLEQHLHVLKAGLQGLVNTLGAAG